MRKPQVKMNKPVYIGFSILELIKFKCKSYGMIILKKNIIKKASFVLLIQISLWCISRPKISLKILQKFYKNVLYINLQRYLKTFTNGKK